MKNLFTIILICGFSVAHCQLDPLYNQYQFNQLMINPAYAGIYNNFSFSAISRLQWVGVEGAPKTNTLLINSALRDGKIGLGALLISDRLGVNHNLESHLLASYNIQMQSGKLAMGLQGGYLSQRYDLSLLELDYVDDSRLQSGLENINQPTFGFGIMFLTETFFAGISIPRLKNILINDGVTSSTRYKRHYYLSTGYFFETSRFTAYKISSLIRYVEDEQLYFDLSFSSLVDQIVWVGFTMRDLKHFGLFTNIEVNNSLRFGYSFEMPTSSLVRGNYGTHEVAITLDLGLSNSRVETKRRF